MDITNPAELKALLQRHNLWAKKGLGQHFLIDREVIEQTIAASELEADDVVVEIGPGCGVLTSALAPHVKKIHAVEIDSEIIPVLNTVTESFHNIEIHNQDIRTYQPPEQYKVIANIPYYLTGKILRYFLEELDNRPTLLVLMTQKEVAEKICAEPPDANLLSTAVHTFGTPDIITTVPARSFYPSPSVDSAVIRIRTQAPPVSDLKRYFSIVRAAFSQPRKQIHNTLKASFPDRDIDTWLSDCGIAPTRRPQTLSIEDWIRLSK